MTTAGYEVDRSPKRRDGTNSDTPWAIWRKGVIGGAGRSLIAKFKSKARAGGLTDKLNAGGISEARVRELARAAAAGKKGKARDAED